MISKVKLWDFLGSINFRQIPTGELALAQVLIVFLDITDRFTQRCTRPTASHFGSVAISWASSLIWGGVSWLLGAWEYCLQFGAAWLSLKTGYLLNGNVPSSVLEWLTQVEPFLCARHPFSHHSIDSFSSKLRGPVLQMSTVKPSCWEVGTLAELMSDRVGFCEFQLKRHTNAICLHLRTRPDLENGASQLHTEACEPESRNKPPLPRSWCHRCFLGW